MGSVFLFLGYNLPGNCTMTNCSIIINGTASSFSGGIGAYTYLGTVKLISTTIKSGGSLSGAKLSATIGNKYYQQTTVTIT